MNQFVSSIALVALFTVSCSALSCKDESGRNVDWFMAIKIPRIQESGAPFNTGYSYAYITSDDAKGSQAKWRLGKYTTKEEKSIFGQTLADLYASPKKYSHIMYNDAPPHGFGKESGSRAHAKGVVALDATTGYWLVHSVPKFPTPPSARYEYPDTGRDNGQSALCISVKSQQEGEDILKQLTYMGPNVYDVENNAGLNNLNSLFEAIEKRKWAKDDKANVETISSQKGESFQSISRNLKAASKGELYTTVVAPYLKSDMIVETWRRGAGGNLPSDCSKKAGQNVMNVAEMSLNLDDVKKTTGTWPYLKDHSKWGISADSSKPFVCIGDINRMESQLKRGGGTVCLKNKAAWSLFRESVKSVEPCGK